MEGKNVPNIVFKTRVREMNSESNDVCSTSFKWKDVRSSEIFSGKKIVVFAIPGAFTPTCSSTHLPGYEELYDEIKATGIDEIYCLSVNDAFVMFQWGRHQKVGKVKFLPDGGGDFTRFMGMLVKKNNLGFGLRSWRYSMVVNDGVIEKMFVEPGFSDDCLDDPFEVSDAKTMLEYLKKE